MSLSEDRGKCAWRDSAASLRLGAERQDDTATLCRKRRELVDQPLKPWRIHDFVGFGAIRKKAEDAFADALDQQLSVCP